MSGGHYDYLCFKIEDMADCIKHDLARLNGPPDEWGHVFTLSPDTERRMRECLRRIDEAAKIAHAVEWFMSGDDGEDVFAERVDPILKGGE